MRRTPKIIAAQLLDEALKAFAAQGADVVETKFGVKLDAAKLAKFEEAKGKLTKQVAAKVAKALTPKPPKATPASA